MKILHYFLTLTIIFLLVINKSDGRNSEFKYNYHLNVKSYAKRGSQTTVENYSIKGDLTIKEKSGNWLECHLDNVSGNGVNYLDKMSQKFMVKINNGKVVDFKSNRESSYEANTMKKEMIEQVLLDTSWTKFIREGVHEIEMPFGGKCEAEVTEKIIENNKFFMANTTVTKCVVEDKVLSKLNNFGQLAPARNFLTITVVYDTNTRRKIELSLNYAIERYNWIGHDRVYSSDKNIIIKYL